ncbi:MAG: Na-K-Cl cotransporter, partial [Saprospiraceae bacterium]|nr:Na-K-Cl cotransporter [Saprospiraceae bacterium]
PLYIAQALAVAMYLFGFREGWNWVFPEHPTLLVDVVAFGLIFLIANISADFAFKIQYIVLAIIGLSLVSIGLGVLNNPISTDIELFGKYEGSIENNFSGSNFWIVFAVYFPAVTGIMAGANMSGDLKDPAKSIPSGTLAAIIISYVVYITLAIFIAMIATQDELLTNYNILIDKAFFAPIVLAGLLGATFSSALSSLVGAPRILQALGENNILVYNDRLAKKDSRGEPKFAFYFTCVVVLLSLLMRDLNAIAPLLTMFFLITYAMINVVVLIEQGLGQISFRPRFKVNIIVPLLGAIGCFFVMFIINSTVGLISIMLVVAMYVYLARLKTLENQEGDTRSGMFNSLAEWSAKVVSKLPEASERAWQPNLLVPAQGVNDVVRSFKTIYNLARPKGSVKILGYINEGSDPKLPVRLPELCEYFVNQDISATSALIHSDDYMDSVLNSMQSLKASFFTPNTIFLSLTDEVFRDVQISQIARKAREYEFGTYLYVPYGKVGLGIEKTISLWINLAEVDRDLKYRVSDCNLGLLTAYLLKRNWHANLTIIGIIPDSDNPSSDQRWASGYLKRLVALARMPRDTQLKIVTNSIQEALREMPHADLNIVSLRVEEVDMQKIRSQVASFETSMLYTIDSGLENALA